MKDKISILDSNFRHSKSKYCSDFQFSENFEWDRSLSEVSEIIVITDDYLQHNISSKLIKVAWLIEPISIKKQTYEFIKKNTNMFDFILTHEKSLLGLSENIYYVPFGGCWIEEKDQYIYSKSKDISIIASSKSQTEGHILRQKVISEYSEYMDVYGKGRNEIELKIDGLKDYRFSIVIENCKRDYYFTEKLIDCFKTGTIPIYWGCPSINNFFDVNGMILFDNWTELKDIIKICDESLYLDKFEYVKNNFLLSTKYVLPDEHIYNFYNEKIVKH